MYTSHPLGFSSCFSSGSSVRNHAKAHIFQWSFLNAFPSETNGRNSSNLLLHFVSEAQRIRNCRNTQEQNSFWGNSVLHSVIGAIIIGFSEQAVIWNSSKRNAVEAESTKNFRVWGFEGFGAVVSVTTIIRNRQYLKLSRSYDITSWVLKIRDQRDQRWRRSIELWGQRCVAVSRFWVHLFFLL